MTLLCGMSKVEGVCSVKIILFFGEWNMELHMYIIVFFLPANILTPAFLVT